MALEAIISGGGIGGLATAAALAQRGWRVRVFETQAELRSAGAGIYLHNNGLAVLREIGAYDRVMHDPFVGIGVEQRDGAGEVILHPHLPPGRVMITVARRDLMAGLAGAARDAGVEIVTRAEVVDAEADGSLHFANGDHVTADLAIGCDGVNSPVRRGLGLERHHQRTAEGALRTIISATQDDMPPEVRNMCSENWSGRRRILVTPINAQEVYLAMTCPADDEEARDPRIRDCWRESFPYWAKLIDRIEPEKVSWNVYSVIKCKAWSSGRAGIVGDAAHATTPNMGQGGGMAMQNGLALAAFMSKVDDPRDIPSALAAWEVECRPLTEHCQYWSTMFGELANVPDEHRASIIRNTLPHPWVRACLVKTAMSTPLTATDWTPTQAAGLARLSL